MSYTERLTARGAALVERLTGSEGDGKDVTDPRELYIILSKAESTSSNRCCNVPNLVTEATLQQKFNHEMKIRVLEEAEGRPDTPPAHHQSSLELYDPEELPTLSLIRQASSLEDLSTLKKNERKRSSQNHLPKLQDRRQLFTNGDEYAKDCDDVVLPKVPKVLQKTLPIIKPAIKPSEPEVSPSDEPEKKVDWRLSGVPDEFRERTKQILMEETHRERLRARGLGLNRNRSLFPKENYKTTDLKAYEQYPDQYWELRAESVTRPEDLESDMIDRDMYRKQQRSMLRLKGMDGEGKAKSDRASIDLPSPSSPHKDVHRPRHGYFKAKANFDSNGQDEDSVAFSPVTKLMLGPVVAEAVPTNVNETDSVIGPPNSRKAHRNRLPHILYDEPLVNNIQGFSKYTYTQVVGTTRPKYLPPTTVVNLTINQETPKQRRPKHIEENIRKQKKVVRVSESAPSENTLGLFDQNSPSNEQRSNTVHGNVSDHVIDSPPQSDDTRNNASLLTGFKAVEVFGETKPKPRESSQHKIKVVRPKRSSPKCHPPTYKLDLRNYPPRGNMIEAFFGVDKVNDNKRSPSDHNPLALRVIDGELIFSPAQHQSDTSRTVKSEGTVKQESLVVSKS